MQRLKTSPNEKAAETLVDAIDPEDKFEFASATTISERKINGCKTVSADFIYWGNCFGCRGIQSGSDPGFAEGDYLCAACCCLIFYL